jgi:hypothetical protein
LGVFVFVFGNIVLEFRASIASRCSMLEPHLQPFLLRFFWRQGLAVLLRPS